MITLNIGGKLFYTTLDTITKNSPNYFAENLDKIVQIEPFFVDRDPEMFGHLLNYMRGYTLNFKNGPISELHNLDKLKQESDFYGITDLNSQIKYFLDPTMDPLAQQIKLEELDQVFQKELLNYEKETASKINLPKDFIPVISLVNASIDEINGQIKLRADLIREWKIKIHRKSVTKVFLMLAMFSEYLFPTSPFANDFSKKVYESANEKDGIFSEAIQEFVQDELDHHLEKKMPSTLKLVMSFLVIIFAHGLGQPGFKRSPDTETPNWGQVISQNPAIKETYNGFFNL